MLLTGLRISDAVPATWGQFKDGRMRIRQVKTGDEMWVPLSRKAQAFLETLPRGEDGDRLFPEVVRNTFENAFLSARRRAKVTGSPHSLRRTFATRLYNAGVPQKIIAMLLGQASTSMTHHYTVLDWDALEKSVNAEIF
jgi:integrase